jgi:glycosyltransferase involved in cell wall biosynthesis
MRATPAALQSGHSDRWLVSPVLCPRSSLSIRVLHIIPTLDRDGTGTQLVLLATHLPRDSFDIHVVALDRGGPLVAHLREAGVAAEVVGRRWLADPLAYWKLRRHIRRLRPDVVHTWGAAGPFSRRAAVREGCRNLIHSERRTRRRRSRWQAWLDRTLAGGSVQVVTDSAAVREDLIGRGLPAEKVTTIPPGVGPAVASGVTRGELLAELGLPSDSRLIGAVGRLVPGKRVKDLIWAAELLSVLHPSVRLVVIGEGPQRQDLESFASLASSPGRVSFLGHRDDVGRILPHLDVLWQGSEDTGTSRAVLEAMAAGVPVVATDTPGHRELVVPGETGFLVPIAGRAQYARTTDQILSDPELAQSLGDSGRRRVKERHSLEQMIGAYVRLYQEQVVGDENR